MKTQHRIRTRTLRSGYTLLELLLALALTMLLVAAVSTTLYGYYFVRNAGERQIDASRHWIASSQRLREDLLEATRSIGQRTPRNQSIQSSDPFVTQNGIGERVLDLGFTFDLDPIALVGDAEQVCFCALQSVEHQERTLSAKRIPLKQTATVWNGSKSNSLSIPVRKSKSLTVFQVLQIPNHVPLTNIIDPTASTHDGNRLQRISLTLGDRPKVEQTIRFEPELRHLRFRYNDGTQWLDRWNSADGEAFPDAIEVTMHSWIDEAPLVQILRIPGKRPQDNTSSTALTQLNSVKEMQP